MNSWCINYNQYKIKNRIKNKFLMKAVNYACFIVINYILAGAACTFIKKDSGTGVFL